MERIRVLVVDDHPVFRYGMRALLSAEPDIELVGEATDGEEAIQLAASLHPDVILMDLNMPGTNGIEATRRILEDGPQREVGTLMLTMFEDDDSIFAAMRAGARGYVLKGADGAETLRAIRAVARGEAIFGPSIARRLTQYFATPRQEAAGTGAFPELTERERDILALIARGYTNTAIADRLYLSPKTVRNYVSSIFTKLQVAEPRGSHRARPRSRAGTGKPVAASAAIFTL
jgi:DNA-binding NarL/FixJ family response regulator